MPIFNLACGWPLTEAQINGCVDIAWWEACQWYIREDMCWGSLVRKLLFAENKKGIFHKK